MKRFLTPAFLFLSAFAASLFFQHYSLACKEFFGLFLFTPDYFTEVFSGPLPVSNLIGSFLTQFYYYSALGAAITAAIATGVFLLINDAFRASGSSVPGTIAGCAAWMSMAFSEGISTGVAALLLSTVLCLLSHLFRFKWKAERWWSVAVSLALISGCLCFTAVSKGIRKAESWSKIEYATINHDWQKVLETATPYKCISDRKMIPFALLALNGYGQLSDNIKEYFIESTSDLDMAEDNSREALVFNSILYEMLGVPNEALHCTFQAGCTLEHGISNGLLRQLVKFNLMAGNASMVAKYGTILIKNPVNSRIGRQVLKMTESMVERSFDGIPSSEAATVTHDPYFNLIMIGASGNESDFLYDRIRAYQIINPEINNNYIRYERKD